MADINSDIYTQLGLNKTTETTTTSKNDTLGQEEFLELMTAQLQYQDPLEPMENGDFIGQMASFGTVSGIGDLNEAFSSMSAAFQSNQALQASTMVGRQVLVESNVGAFNNEGVLEASVELDLPATNVIVTISDSSGQIVDRQELGAQSAGLVDYEWNGTGTNGEEYSSGAFQVSAEIQRGNDTSSGVTLTSVQVESVTLGQGGQDLTLSVTNLGDISMSQVRKIM